MKYNGAEILIHLLERQGISIISGIPGGANLPIYDALGKSRIRHILARHEQGAGFIAHGLARSTGLPAVCMGTSGPGATNLITAIADARLDSIPIVAITGQVPLGMIGTDAFQEIDTFGLTLPICKHNYLVRTPAELLEVVPEAFRIAMSDRPGPVVIDIPKDVQLAVAEMERFPEPGAVALVASVSDFEIQEFVRMVNGASRPAMIAGGGIIAADAAPIAREFATMAQIPTAMTLMGLGIMPAAHPLSLGMLGMHGETYTNLVLQEADLIIAAGMRFDDRATGKLSEFCPHARVIHIDIDASEIGKNRRPDFAIVGDVGDVLTRVCAMGVDDNGRSAWLHHIAHRKEEAPKIERPQDGIFAPFGLIRTCAAAVGEQSIVTTDVGQHQMWAAQAYPFTQPRQWLTSGGLGTMGFGVPAAIGAALAHPRRTVLCFTGDGSFMMNIQELATLAEAQLNVKIILLDNGSLGLVRQQQDFFYGGRKTASCFQLRPDFVALARGFGIEAHDLARSSEPEEELCTALRNPGPCFVLAPINETENVFPMVPPGASNAKMITSKKDLELVG